MIRFTWGGAHGKWFVFVRSPKFAIGSQWRNISFYSNLFFIHSLPGACSAQRKGKEFEGVEIGWGWSTSSKTVSLLWPSSSPVLSNPMKLSACLSFYFHGSWWDMTLGKVPHILFGVLPGEGWEPQQAERVPWAVLKWPRTTKNPTNFG